MHLISWKTKGIETKYLDVMVIEEGDEAPYKLLHVPIRSTAPTEISATDARELAEQALAAKRGQSQSQHRLLRNGDCTVLECTSSRELHLILDCVGAGEKIFQLMEESKQYAFLFAAMALLPLVLRTTFPWAEMIVFLTAPAAIYFWLRSLKKQKEATLLRDNTHWL